MQRPYAFFNLACFGFIIFFGLGTGWQWRVVFTKHGTWNMEHGTIDDQQFPLEINQLSARVTSSDQEIMITDQPETNDESKVINVTSTEQRSQIIDHGSLDPENVVEVLPVRFNLAVPFTSQAPEKNWDQPWQDACEEAAVLMLDAYYKKYGLSPLFAKDEIIKMVAWEEKQGWGRSIEIEKVQTVYEDFLNGKAKSKKQKAKIIVNPTIEQIKELIANGNPVLVVADGKVLPNPHFRNGGPEYHALIIRGYTEDSFITNDPGTQFGENFVYKYDDLMNAVRDWNGGDVKQGRRVVLILN